mgnify:FL=1
MVQKTSCGEHRQFPLISASVVSQDVDTIIVGDDLEVAVPRTQPAVEKLLDGKTPIVQVETPGSLFATVASMTLDLERPLLRGIGGVVNHHLRG